MNENNDIKKKVDTTGHSWDGIEELNNPTPRWWLWIFFLTCIWAIGYWVVYPAWPTLSGKGFRGGSKGKIEWNQYVQLENQQAEIKERRSVYLEKFRNSTFAEIINDQNLYNFAVTGGKSAFKENCATCHGTGGSGGKGYPNLNDDEWLWGGTHNQIYSSIKYGIRSVDQNTKTSDMPAFSGMLNKEEIDNIAQYIINLANGDATPKAGRRLYKQQCAYCHGNDGAGDSKIGAPNLVDSIWLYSNGSKEDIISQIKHPKHGVMPSWNGRLNEDTIRYLTIFVHSLGGGK